MAPKKGKNRLAEPKERDKKSAPAVTGSEKDGKSVKSKAEGSAATRGSGALKSNLPGKPEIPEIAVTGSGKELNSAAIDKLFEEALNQYRDGFAICFLGGLLVGRPHCFSGDDVRGRVVI